MFDTVEIGRRISRLRKEKDMTQPALADKMGVSYQAVSNWERGASMPDIGKLPELAETLGVSVDELLGGGRGSELVRHVLDGSEEAFVEEKDVTLEEAGEAAPLLKPRQVTRIVRAIHYKKERREQAGDERADAVSVASLASIAPFLDEDTLDELAERLEVSAGVGELAAIAPFLSERALDHIAGRVVAEGAHIGKLAGIAPFLSEEALGKLAVAAMDEKEKIGDIASIAPFLSKKALGEIALKAVDGADGVGGIAAIAPFLGKEELDAVVKKAIQNGRNIGEMGGLLPFLSRETLRALMEAALAGNDPSFLSKLGKFL